MPWTYERIEKLKQLWDEGLTASRIAAELGDVTRNAVIGKVHRLGLSNRDTNISKSGATPTKAIKNAKRGRPPKVNQEPKKRGRPQKPKGPSAFREKINDDDQSISPSANSKLSRESTLEVVSDLSEETIKNLLKVEMKSKKISLMELTERTCKWPIGDPATDTYWFCGHESEPGKPYCKTHISIAFQPITQRRSRKESQ